MEIYTLGAVLPGVVGVICLVLALTVSQIIPINAAAVALLVVGAVLIGLELYISSIALGLGGIVALVLGMFYYGLRDRL